ncbi:DUF6702 family protein [Chitinophaga solisilvae]|uniref:Uncharacterized protein n=1 Tax=Chitinophaga solisilvae TaxID=1233460 RepID=A0A9Q5GUX7_9BACT|nr:DUF6702 family protein [Chitinophaga solisilvae]NSL90471.1 hypothetical protein [Chitinophaga solisilvae]
MGLLLCKWWITLWMAALHPFYVSVTEVTHNAAKRELEVSCRIFTDDLENTLKAQYKTTFDITRPANRAQVEGFIADYLSKHLQLTLDGKPVALHFLGYKIEEDAVWSFLEAEHIAAPRQVAVKNDLLYTQHPSQINMMHIIVGGVRKSVKLDNPKSDALLHF